MRHSGTPVHFDLLPLLHIDELKHLRAWGDLVVRPSEPSLPANILSALTGVVTAAPLAPEVVEVGGGADEAEEMPMLVHSDLGDRLAQSLRALLEKRATNADDGYMDFVALSLSASEVEVLVDFGVFDARDDEFGESQVALHGNPVMFSTQFECTTNDIPVLRMPLAANTEDTAHKMSLLVELVRLGWDDAYVLEEHHPGEKKMLMSMSVRSRYYFLCLLRAQSIFEVGMPILTKRPEVYYKCLLDRKALGLLAQYTNEAIERMTSRHFASILAGQPAPPPGAPALADGDIDVSEDGDGEGREDVLALMDDDDQDGALAEALVGPALAGTDAAAALRPVLVMGYTIKFDFWSHASRQQRGYVQCKFHPRCYKYRQTNLAPDRRSLIAFLLAWAEAGGRVSRNEHVHKHFAPTEAELAIATAHLVEIETFAA